MKKIIILPFLFFTSFSFSQQEASNWYFGYGAGIKFNTDGTVTALTDGRLNTLEGCATLSDSNGELMFYTDGTTVYNKNHQIMLNGTGLKGHNSSTQSATIIQKPGSPNMFYVFTTTAGAMIDGFQYSEIDLSLDGGLGGVTANKNIPIYTPTCEKLSVVKHANNTDYWVITHGWENNTFYSYLLTASGVSITPVITNSGTVVGGSNKDRVQGYMKISPDGTKLALCHQFLEIVELYDFDNATGIVSNPIIINNYNQPYGVEFSPDSNVLYTSHQIIRKIYQYDLTVANIPSSQKLIAATPTFLGALQLGPDNKIYIANHNTANLGVINDPNNIGLACNVQANAVDLAGRKSMLGLPCFNQSFFNPTFTAKNLCLGNTTEFTLTTAQTIISASWNFGDGTTSHAINATHTYSTPGIYTVSVMATSATGTSTKTRDIIISTIPTATQPQDLFVCDDDNDGLFTFDLVHQNAAILNGQDPNLFTVTYFANATDYANNVALTTPNNYTNLQPYLQQTILAEVSNNANASCKSTISFNINVFDSPKPNTVIPKITLCDNTSVGTDTDGRVVFDLTQKATTILNGQLATKFSLSYFKDAALTQGIVTPAAYQNTNPTETIYVKIVNMDNAGCSATTSFPIEVLALPVITNVVSLKQCDDNIDGYSVFNLEEAIDKITVNAATETIAFFRMQSEAQNNSNPIANTTTYTNQMVSNDVVYVRVTNSNGCFRIAHLNLIISTTQIPLNFAKTFTQCDDTVSGTNTDGIAAFDFSSVTNQIQNLFPIGQQLDITYYRNQADALAEKNVITDTANYRNIGYPNTQNIYIRVDSRLNNDCLGLGSHITLKVESVPIVKPLVEVHCDDNQDGKYAFDTSGIQTKLLNGLTNVSVAYLDQSNMPLSSPLPNPFNTASQTLKVVVSNNTPTACSFETILQFVVDDLPEAFSVATALTTVCDDEAAPSLQDGKYAFDTSTFQTTLLGGQTGMTVKYFDGNNNPLSSPLPNPFVTATQNVRVEVINPANAACTASVILPFVVNPVPKISLLGAELVCSNLPTFTKVLDAGLLDSSLTGNYTYVWSFNGNTIAGETNYTLTVNTSGMYTVEVTNNQGCSRTRTITVRASDIANITAVTIVDLAESNSISVTVTGAGDYVYGLDDEYGGYQTESVFNNVTAGIHTVFVKDLNGCGVTLKEVAVLGIPNYFTPNNDGFNDYWNIKGVNASFNAKTIIHIFDRYGKLINQISPLNQGWNGTFNGQQMPATDYWYSVQLEDGRVVKGHFSLKR